MYSRNNKQITKKKGQSYNTKKYDNPFFKQKKKRKIKFNFDFSPNIKIIGIVLFLVAFSFLWALFFSDYFEIKNIDIEGGGKISVDDINKYTNNQLRAKKLFFFKQKNIFLFDKSDFISFLNSKHSFEYLEVKKKYPDGIKISFNEKNYEITWAEDDTYYYTDREGGIITEANLLEIKEKKYPLIQNLSDEKIQENKVSVKKEYLDFSILLFNSISEYHDEFEVEKFIIDNEPDTIKVKVVNGPEIYFNITLDYEKQLRKLLVLKREKIKDNFPNIEYINLKIGDSVYYR